MPSTFKTMKHKTAIWICSRGAWWERGREKKDDNTKIKD